MMMMMNNRNDFLKDLIILKKTMTVIQLTRVVRVLPQYLTSSLNKTILEETRKQLEGNCSESIGHIIKILEVKEIIDNKIENSSSDIVFTVEILVDIFKPEVNMVETGKVIAIYKDGVLIELRGIQKVLVPANSYKDYYVMKNSTFLEHIEGTEIRVGDTIDVKIQAIMYGDHSFSCIGEFSD
jgi:DNA-directed RNA polymerase subunit E'/Rpb7